MIASPEHGCLGGTAVSARNGALGAEPLGLGQAVTFGGKWVWRFLCGAVADGSEPSSGMTAIG
jgi:hypothetical protein